MWGPRGPKLEARRMAFLGRGSEHQLRGLDGSGGAQQNLDFRAFWDPRNVICSQSNTKWKWTRSCARPNGKMAAQCAHIWCLENFRDSLTMPTATFPKIFHGLLFWFSLWMCVQNLKSVALPDPDLGLEGSQKCRSAWICPRSLFSKIFNGL